MRKGGIYLLLICVFFICSCAEKIEQPYVPLIPSDDMFSCPVKDDLDLESLKCAIDRNFEYLDRLPSTNLCEFGNHTCTIRDMKDSLNLFWEIIQSDKSEDAKMQRMRETFDVFKSVGTDGKGRVVFTGYYEPILEGSLKKSEKYCYPIYKIPDDHLVINLEQFRDKYKGEKIIGRIEDNTVVPYYTRKDIDVFESLKGKGLEIAWLADPVDLFFLHIQGSGTIQLDNGEIMQVSYAHCNGHPYRSIGRFLVDQGKMVLEEISLKNIKTFLREHLEEMFEILAHNESYVFFRVVGDGPIGSLNVPVTAGRTIATDASCFPRGALAFIRLKKPVVDREGKIISWIPFSRFVLNQDAGGAIKGTGRVDLFCGKGIYAETMAGHLKEEGELYFLVKKAVSE